MGLNLISYPQIIIKQATAPTITSASLLWRDTDDNVLYFSDGVGWQQFSSASTSAGFESMVSELALEILRLSAEGVLNAPDYNGMFVDFFSAAGGEDGTIDTSGTTALFSTDEYKNGGGVETGSSNYTGETTTTDLTMNFNATAEGFISSVEIHTNNTPNTIEVTIIQNSSILATKQIATAGSDRTLAFAVGDFSSMINPAVDSGNFQIRYEKISGTGDIKRDTGTGSYAGSAFTWTNQNMNVYNATPAQEIDFTSTITNKTLITNAQALGFAPAYILIHSKDKTTAGTGAITYDVSFDNGATNDSTANALDTKISVIDGSGKNMIITLNLNGTGTGNTASLKDYEVVLWSS